MPNLPKTLPFRPAVFAAFFTRPSDALDIAIFLSFVGAATTLAIYGWTSDAGAVVLLVSATQVAVFVWALATLLRLVARRTIDATAYPIAATLVAGALAIDRICYGFFRQHISRAVCLEALDAIRAKALPVDGTAIGAAFLSGLILALVLVVVLKSLSFLPRRVATTLLARRAAVPVLLIVATASSLRECALDTPSFALLPMRMVIPWDGVSSRYRSPAATNDRAAALFGDTRPFEEMRHNQSELLASPLHTRTRPDIVMVHVESLRSDMLREDVMPRVSALTKEWLTTPFHYTTGTNTGTGVFGLLTGLTSLYYPLSRASLTHPLPIEVLRKLGYGVSVFFISNFRSYDGLYDLYFKGVADYTYDGPEQPVYDADAKMVDAYVARLRAAPAERPRFDYLILDSTHYDYSYPPDFERFKPAMTLELGIRDGFAVGDGINDQLKWRGPFVRNRYQNSILWADSLIGRIIDALSETHRLENTIVVITGDHGEEFWEHGSFGHGFFTLSNEQSQVPLRMHLPAGGTSRYRYSSHADVFPTIFDAMGLEPERVRFMNGKSLLRYDPSLDFAVVGFGVTRDLTDVRYAVVGDGLKVYWQNVPPFVVSQVVGDDDEPLASPPASGRVDDLVFRAVAVKELR